MKNINISVVVPLYNKENSILRTVQSVLMQSYKNFEIVIVDDGSTDKSVEKLQTLHDSRIKIVSKKNGGVSNARNRGIKEAKYDYIAFLDGDDVWSINHLSVLVKMIREYPECKMFYTQKVNHEIDDSKEIYSCHKIKNYILEVLKGNGAHSSTICLKKEYLLTNNLFFDETLTLGEDLDFWYRTALGCEAVYNSMRTVIYKLNFETRKSLPYPKYLYQHYAFNLKRNDFQNIEYGIEYYLFMLSNLIALVIYKHKYRDLLSILKKQGPIQCCRSIIFVLKRKICSHF